MSGLRRALSMGVVVAVALGCGGEEGGDGDGGPGADGSVGEADARIGGAGSGDASVSGDGEKCQGGLITVCRDGDGRCPSGCNWIEDDDCMGLGRIAAGDEYSCVLLDTGRVRCWGANYSGQLGYGDGLTCTADPDSSPLCLPGDQCCFGDDEIVSSAGDVDVGGTVVQVVAGGSQTCALLDSGRVRCWGDNAYGQLGYGHSDKIGDDEVPAEAGDVDVGGSVVQVSAGKDHTCVLLDAGRVRCWGRNTTGQLGYGHGDNIGDDEVPASAGDVDVGGSVVQISAGPSHTCALLDTGRVRCWGYNTEGQLGYGHSDNIGDDEVPASAGDVDVGGSVVQISAGSANTCALLDTGRVRCWGRNTTGQLGYGNSETIGDDETPASAGDVNVGGSVVQIATGGFHTCALLDTGRVRCWGQGDKGILGYPNPSSCIMDARYACWNGPACCIGDDEAPATAGDVDVGGIAAQISAGPDHTCVLLDTGGVRCWGSNLRGQLGYGNSETIGDDETPASAGDVPYR